MPTRVVAIAESNVKNRKN